MKHITIGHTAELLSVGSRQAVEYYVKKGDLHPIWISQGHKSAVRLFDHDEVMKLIKNKLDSELFT